MRGYQEVFWVWFLCVCRVQNLTTWCVRLNRGGRCLVWGRDGYISFGGLNVKPIEFMLYRIELISGWRCLSSLKGSLGHLLPNTTLPGRDFKCLGMNILVQLPRGCSRRWPVRFFILEIAWLCFWISFNSFLAFWLPLAKWIDSTCKVWLTRRLLFQWCWQVWNHRWTIFFDLLLVVGPSREQFVFLEPVVQLKSFQELAFCYWVDPSNLFSVVRAVSFWSSVVR